METIWKYEILSQDGQKIEMPVGARLLDVQMQDDTPMFWAVVNPENETVKREVIVLGTGWRMKEVRGEYAGTFQVPQNGLVFHVFID